MGFNYRYCGFENVQDFVKSMCVSEKNISTLSWDIAKDDISRMQ